MVILESIYERFLRCGGVFRSERYWFRNYITVKSFGAKGDGVNNDTRAFIKYKEFLEEDSAFRGGIFRITKGVYKLTETVEFINFYPERIHNIEIKGDGALATTLIFDGLSDQQDGISFGAGAHFRIDGIGIFNAGGNGLSIIGAPRGGSDYSSMGEVVNCRFQGNGKNGFYSSNAYMLSLSGCWSKSNGKNGFCFNGFHTSLNVSRCASSHNLNGAGWDLNGVIYSAFTALGSDENLWGYTLSNCRSLVFNACGAEANLRDAVYIIASNSSGTNLPSEIKNTTGIIFNSFYAFHSSKQSAGSFATFMSIYVIDGRFVDVTLNSCSSIKYGPSDKAIIANCLAGKISIRESSQNYDGEKLSIGNVVWG